MDNKCMHPDCTIQKPRTQYACKKHWFSLPKTIRDKIWDGYRSHNASEWVKASDEAIEYWQPSTSTAHK